MTVTVNKVAENKKIKAIINVKEITGGYTNKDNTNSTNSSTEDREKVHIAITANGTTLWSGDAYKDESNKEAEISGKGTMDITLTIGNETRRQQVNFDTATTVTFSK